MYAYIQYGKRKIHMSFSCLDLDEAMVDPCCELQVDVAILEVGLGGRFDSTNVVSILHKILDAEMIPFGVKV